MSPDLAPHKTKSVQAAKKLEEWKKSLVVGAKVDFQDFTARTWTSGVVTQRKEAEEYAAMEQQRWQYQQYPTAAHIKVTVAGLDGRDEESDWLSVNHQPRLAPYGSRAGGGTQYEDLDDADDPDDPAVFACEHGKAYGCKSLVDAINCFGRAGGFTAMHARLHGVEAGPAETALRSELITLAYPKLEELAKGLGATDAQLEKITANSEIPKEALIRFVIALKREAGGEGTAPNGAAHQLLPRDKGMYRVVAR